MNFAIRPAAPSDAQSIYALERAYIDCAWNLSQIEQELNKPSAVFLKAEVDGAIVGYVSGEVGADECELSNIAVHAAYRRKGVGTALLAELARILKIRGVNKAFLLVRADNAGAIALYGKSGFVPVGRRRAYYKDGDALIMQKNL